MDRIIQWLNENIILKNLYVTNIERCQEMSTTGILGNVKKGLLSILSPLTLWGSNIHPSISLLVYYSWMN